MDFFTLAREPRGSIRHHTFPLCRSDFTTQVGLARLAKLAFTTFSRVEWDDVVSGFDVGDTFTDAFDDASAFVTEDRGEQTFRVFAREGVRVGVADGRAVRRLPS